MHIQMTSTTIRFRADFEPASELFTDVFTFVSVLTVRPSWSPLVRAAVPIRLRSFCRPAQPHYRLPARLSVELHTLMRGEPAPCWGRPAHDFPVGNPAFRRRGNE